MPSKSVTIDHEGNVSVVTLQGGDSPFCLDGARVEALTTVLQKLKTDPATRGVVLTGHGKTFAAGVNLAELAKIPVVEAAAFADQGQRLMFSLEKLGKPIIAAVNGSAFGAGLELALASDFITCSESATFCFPEIRSGLLPAFGGMQRLVRVVGKAKAKEMVFTGDEIGSREAYDIGLVNRIYRDDDVVVATVKLMEKICSHGPVSLRVAKEVMAAGYDTDLATACLMERDAFALCFATEDQKEGMRAFMDKRKPQFPGK